MIPPLVGNLPCFKDLIAVLFECFLIILLGYLSARFKFISPKAKDLNSYLTTFALPMIIFLNIAQMEFQTINLAFLLCMLAAKLLVFIVVTILTLIVSYPTNFGYAGALSILATQSNDFALGYPLIKSLYGESRTEMLNYLSLMAPIQLLILNPLGIAMLEYQKSRRLPARRLSEVEKFDSENDCECSCQEEGVQEEKPEEEEEEEELQVISVGHISSISCDLVGEEISQRVRRRTSVSEDSPRSRQMRLASRINKNIKFLKLKIPSGEEARSAKQQAKASQRGGPKRYPSDRTGSTFEGCEPSGAACCIHCRGLTGLRSLPALVGHRSSKGARERPNPRLNLNFLQALATNPLIIASVVALTVNRLYGPELPRLVTKVSNTIAASFAAPALFVVGLSMSGKFQLLIRNPSELMLSSVLVITKIVLLPSLLRTLASLILPGHTPPEELHYLIDFSFLYGLLPTAPTACIIANQYGILTNVVSISMLLSTFLSAPLTLAASAIINPAMVVKVEELERLTSQTLEYASSLSVLLGSLVLFAFWRSRRRIMYRKFVNLPLEVPAACKIKSNPIHIFLILLASSQILIGLAGAGWFLMEAGSAHKHQEGGPVQDLSDERTFALSNNFSGQLQANEPEVLPLNLPAPIPAPESRESGPFGQEERVARDESEQVWAAKEEAPAAAGAKTLNSIQYIVASLGVLIARFVILCIVITTAAIRLKGYSTASRLSAILLKSLLPLSLALSLWLIFETQQVQEGLHQPIDSTIPSSKSSLYVRLLYESLFLLLSVPLFALIIRSHNRSRRLLENFASLTASERSFSAGHPRRSLSPPEVVAGSSRGGSLEVVLRADAHLAGSKGRNFLTSSVSLSSDTSSALTTNTNLDSAILQDLNNNNNNSASLPALPSGKQHPRLLSATDSISVSISDGSSPPNISRKAFNAGHSQQAHTISQHGDTSPESQFANDPQELAFPSTEPNRAAQLDRKSLVGFIQMSEFNKYSILILFSLITTIINSTSIIQKLVQEEAFGTFRQIEIMSAALEFGQGLLTFLVYGFKGLFN